ncbi:conserved hypothetical protein [Trichinella spiralis]|uniref:hypothetical protein n=1 Tax=Trichinella spiralis TaxID=6334 RepID=UPI0001EFCA4C|nr:conserved hypothetical protein [Trichinella spiralis]
MTWNKFYTCTLCLESRIAQTQAPVHPWKENNTRTSWKSNQASNAIYVSSYITKRQLFTTHGLPEMIVLNDATAYTSNKFQNFTANYIALEIYSIRKFERMVCRR